MFVLNFIDSDAFIGWMLARDAHHKQASILFERLKTRHAQATTTSFVVTETATVLSHAGGQALANTFLQEVIKRPQFSVVFIDETLYEAALDIFGRQTARGTSVADCANVAVMRQLAIPEILSFDKVYARDFALKMVESEG